MNIKPRNRFSPDFQMASMTDMIFLLLIFFMLTSTLVNPNALKLILPTSEKKEKFDPKSVSVSITKDLEYYVDRDKVNLTEMKSVLKKRLGNLNKPSVVVHAEKSVPIENVVQVMNIGYDLRVSMILATQPQK